MAIDPAFRAEVESKLDAYRHRLADSILAAAKEKCPKKTGRLAESLKAEVTADGRVLVGTEVEYALDVEFGTAPHIIRVRRARVLANRETGQVFGVS
jgi:phage gpG-like protein